LQERIPIQHFSWVVGWCMLLSGVLLGVSQILMTYPFLLLIGVGVMSLAISAICHPDGLLAQMPTGFQNFLSRTTVFDLFHDDSAFTNFARRWTRITLLVLEPSDEQVKHLLRGLNPDWLRSLFYRPLLGYLPYVAKRVLLPEKTEISIDTAATEVCAARPGTAADATAVSPLLDDVDLLNQSITQKLREMDQAKTQLITEPALMPALCAYTAAGLLGESWATAAWRGVRATLATAAVSWGAYLVMLLSPIAQTATSRWLNVAGGILGGYGVLSLPSAVGGDGAVVRKGIRNFAAVFSVMGIGGLVITRSLQNFLGGPPADALTNEPPTVLRRLRDLLSTDGLACTSGISRVSEPEEEALPTGGDE